MPNSAIEMERVDGVLHALADPTRRRIVERLSRGPAATTELARPFAMALPSFTQHLKVLEAGGLATSTKKGRVRTYRLSADSLDLVDQWLAAQRQTWERRLDQLDQHLQQMKE